MEKKMFPEGVSASLLAAAIDAGAAKYCNNRGEADDMTAIRICNFAAALLAEAATRAPGKKA